MLPDHPALTDERLMELAHRITHPDMEHDGPPIEWGTLEARIVYGLKLVAAEAERVALGVAWVKEGENLDGASQRGYLAGVRSVVRIRCTKHRNVDALNTNEVNGGECGACVEREGRARGLEEALAIVGARGGAVGRLEYGDALRSRAARAREGSGDKSGIDSESARPVPD